MKEFFSKIVRARLLSSLFGGSFLLVLSGIFWVYGKLQSVKGPLVVHFDDLFGISRIGDIFDILQPGFVCLLVILVNFLIALELEEKDRFLPRFLAGMTLFFSILIFISFAAIISVN